MKKPYSLWILVFFLVFLALGGFVGAYYFLTDPSGASIGMEKELALLPVPDYTLPGIFLLLVMTITPLFLTFGLIAKPNIPSLQTLLRFAPYHWSWTGTVLLGIILMLWLAVEAYFIGITAPIQYITAINGLLILVLPFLPAIKNYYTGQ
ncbi:MAG: hypothetical protein IH589_15855 [Anaerolineales bacterium]|nr:hypothetical protein [Anaerolineales bacterium]